MKKITFYIPLFAFFFFTACEFAVELETDFPTSNGISHSNIEPNQSRSVEFSSSEPILEVEASTKSLTISGDLAGKTVYYVQVNTGNAKVDNSLVRYISSDSERAAVSTESEEIFQESETSKEGIICHHGYDFHPEFTGSAERSVYYPREVSKLSYNVGITKKQIFTARTEYEYEKKAATLWAFNEICNVWIVDDDPYISSKSAKESIAKKYAENFKALYPLVRNIFGKESDFIYSSTRGSKAELSSVSDTGTKVNIVIYDLFNDKSLGNTVGFFSSMDYYMNGLAFSNITIKNSNEGKYFYIDSYFAKTKNGLTLSTLAHEFQHMINFGVKTMNGISIDSNFNEMLSMLCEDMLQEYLGISDTDSPKGRLREFISQYYNTGIRNFDNTTLSYANAYGFGAWLCRQYGGAALVREMMQNSKSNNDCIVSAVNALNRSDYDFDEIFGKFIMACLGDTVYTFNQDAEQTVRYSQGGLVYDYPMAAINLWGGDNSVTIPSGSRYRFFNSVMTYLTPDYKESYQGPAIFKNNTISSLSEGYGMIIKSYRTLSENEDSITLNFTSNSGKTNTGIVTYIYIK